MNDNQKQLIRIVVAVGVVVAAVGVIAVGNIHFNDRVQSSTRIIEAAPTNTVVPEESTEYEAYIKNLPAAAQEKIVQAVKTKTPLQLVIAGDEATPTNEGGWPQLLAAKLAEAYGPDVFRITVKSYPEKTTQHWIDERVYEDIIRLQPDILIYEPALLLDGGEIEKQQSVHNTQLIIDEIGRNVSDAVVLVQPPHPLYGAQHYPQTVQMVRDMVQSTGYTYIDHWQAWPHNEDLLQYLEEPTGWANTEGQHVWATYMGDYFVAK